MHQNLTEINDKHRGCDTSKELKRSFEPAHKRLIGEELKDPQMYKGNVRRPILEQMNLQTRSLMERLGVLIARGAEAFSRDSEGGETLMTRVMGKQSNKSGMLVQTMMQGMHGIGGTRKEDRPGMWPSSLMTPIKQINSRVCMSRISKEPSAVSRPEEGGPLSLNHSGNLHSSINMLTLDKSLMTTMPLC